MVAIAPLIAREAACLSGLPAAEERLLGRIEPGEHILQDLGVDSSVFRERRFQVG